MVGGDLGLTGVLAPRFAVVGSKRGRETAISQNLSAMVQIVLLMDHPVRTLRIAMKIVARVSKDDIRKSYPLFHNYLYDSMLKMMKCVY